MVTVDVPSEIYDNFRQLFIPFINTFCPAKTLCPDVGVAVLPSIRYLILLPKTVINSEHRFGSLFAVEFMVLAIVLFTVIVSEKKCCFCKACRLQT
jgi:hypothetical protein